MPNNGFNTPDGSVFLLSEFGGPSEFYPFILSDSLVYNFEPMDLRRTHWVDSIIVSPTTYFFPFKYKLYYTGTPPAEYPMLLRLAEQYLIRAEAGAQQNKIQDAQTDLNVIRVRAGLGNTTANDQATLLIAIESERRFELFTEYGQRWLDLKRTDEVDSVMNKVTRQKGGTWTTTDQLYPIPLSEIKADVNLTQNQGYN
jgi:starch-binding outer membrane protein, SusD/RagB family